MSKELNKAPVEQAGTNVGHGHVFPRADGVKMRCGGPGLCSECAADAYRARAALAQPSPAQTQPSPAPTLRAAIDVANDRFEVPVAKWGTDLVGEEERPEVAEVAFVLRNIGAMDAEDIDGDNVDLRFEDAEGRDTGCDVSIVEYAEKAADLFEQHDRIVGALRAENAKLSEALDRWPLIRDSLKLRLADALARVAELELKLDQSDYAYDNDRHHMRGMAKQAAEAIQVFTGHDSGANLAHRYGEKWWEHLDELRDALLAFAKNAPPAQAQHSVPEGVTIERDVAGTIHIKVGDFDFIQLQYQRPYTDNASTWKLAERIASLLAAAPGKEGV